MQPDELNMLSASFFCVLLLPSASEAAHYSWRYTKFLLFRVQSPAELYIVDISR